MTWFFPLAGVLLLMLLFWDVYVTVFVPRGPAGPVAGRLYRRGWQAWHALVGHETPAARRRLAALGPMMVPLTVLVWALMLLVGFTLILLPFAGTFLVDDAAPFPAWFNALYVTGYSITTLGMGDVLPMGKPLRLVIVLASASGFVLVTIAVTYLLSVYAALDRMTSLAFEIHRFIGRVEGYTPVDVLVTATHAEGHGELSNWLANTASSLAEVVQAEDEFPLLHYFHVIDERSLPLALTDLMELVTLCRSLLNPQSFPALANGLVTGGTARIVEGYFTTLCRKFPAPPTEEDELHREREATFREAWAVLTRASVPLRDQQEAWTRYAALRGTWDRSSIALRQQFGYPVMDAWRHQRQTREQHDQEF